MKIHVSNIDRSTSEDELFELFEEFGEVSEVILNEEPDPGKYTFSAEIIMPYSSEATEAVAELNGENIDGRNLKVTLGKTTPTIQSGEEMDEELDTIEILAPEFEEEDDTGWEKIKRKKPPAETPFESSKNKKKK